MFKDANFKKIQNLTKKKKQYESYTHCPTIFK